MSKTGGPGVWRGLRLLDLSAIIVGYGLASLLVRAFWPSGGPRTPAFLVVLGLVFAWLGLAMSGPIVLALDRRTPDPDDDSPSPRTRAELAWLVIGFYWIALAVLVVPIRVPTTRLFDSAILGLFPILAALALRFLGPKTGRSRPSGPPPWTHHVAVALLVTWPFVWVGLILLGKSL